MTNKELYRNSQRAYSAYQEAVGARKDTVEMMALGEATVDDFNIALARETRAWKHSVASGKRFRDKRKGA